MRIAIKRDIVIPLLLGIVAYIFIYFHNMRTSLNGLGFAVIQALLALILLNSILNKIDAAYMENRLSIAKFTILVACVYFYISSIKYSEGELASGFISDNFTRLLGSFLVFLSIQIAIIVEDKISLKISPDGYGVDWFAPQFYIAIPVFVLFSIFEFNYNINYYSYSVLYIPDAMGQLLMFIYSSLLYFAIMVVAAGFRKSFGSVLLLAIVVMVPLIRALGTGKRSALMLPMLAIGYSFVLYKKISIKTFTRFISIVPFAFLLLTVISFSMSDRMSTFTTEYIAKDIAYRFDFSDFPMTVLSKTSGVYVRLEQILDGIKVSIPSILGGSKSNLTASSTQFYNSIGLNGRDYTDSFFSMGADAFGYIGFVLLFVIIVAVFAKIEVYFSRKGKVSNAYRFACFSLFTHLESSWIYFIPAIRNTILSLIIMKLFFVILDRIRVRRKRT